MIHQVIISIRMAKILRVAFMTTKVFTKHQLKPLHAYPKMGLIFKCQYQLIKLKNKRVNMTKTTSIFQRTVHSTIHLVFTLIRRDVTKLVVITMTTATILHLLMLNFKQKNCMATRMMIKKASSRTRINRVAMMLLKGKQFTRNTS